MIASASRVASVFNRRMVDRMVDFIKDDSGQDLIEYTLLLAFVALAAASLFMSMARSISCIWSNASSKLAQS